MPVFVLFFIGVAVLLAVSMALPKQQRGLVAIIASLVLAIASNYILGLFLLAEGDESRTVGQWFADSMIFLVPNVLAASAIFVLSRRSVSAALILIIACVAATVGLAVGIWFALITECNLHSCM